LALLGFNLNVRAQQVGFGRFGYTTSPRLFGIQVSPSGLKPEFGSSDALYFPEQQKVWKSLVTSPFRHVIGCDGSPGSPSKIRLDIFDYGVSMYFPKGIHLRLRSTSSPVLTWEKGSVQNGIPTPNVNWLALSFQDDQPPMVLGFPEDQTALEISGELGNWSIKSQTSFKGWVRFSLPFGLSGLQTISASSLGKLAKRCSDYETVWYSPVSDTPDPKIEEDQDGLTLKFQLPRKRGVVPSMFYLGEVGGYASKIYSSYQMFPDLVENSPILLTDDSEISVRLPIKRIPAGRGLTIGEPIPQLLPNANWDSPLKVVDLSLANTLSGRAREMSERARLLLGSYFETVQTHEEPVTKQKVFYDLSGNGMLQTAVHCLLAQSVRTGQASEPNDDPQLTCLFWRLDPYSGQLGITTDQERRIKAIASVAGAFSSRPTMRYMAAMFQCALSAERGKSIFLKRRFINRGPQELLEPLLGLRKPIFALAQDAPIDPVVTNWQSEVRCYGDTPVWLQSENGGFQVVWNARDRLLGTIAFESAYKVGLSSRSNIQSIFVSYQPGYAEIRYMPISVGTCAANLIIPNWAKPFPNTALPPTYTETRSVL
jgi:hypothetical protein